MSLRSYRLNLKKKHLLYRGNVFVFVHHIRLPSVIKTNFVPLFCGIGDFAAAPLL